MISNSSKEKHEDLFSTTTFCLHSWTVLPFMLLLKQLRECEKNGKRYDAEEHLHMN